MSVERKDVRAKLDDDMHAALNAICDARGITQAEWIESVIVPVLRQQIADVNDLYSRFQRAGLTGNSRDSSGTRRR